MWTLNWRTFMCTQVCRVSGAVWKKAVEAVGVFGQSRLLDNRVVSGSVEGLDKTLK